jgi:hypothetical protein
MSDKMKKLELPGGGAMFIGGTPKRGGLPPARGLTFGVATADEADDTDPKVAEEAPRAWICDFDSDEKLEHADPAVAIPEKPEEPSDG